MSLEKPELDQAVDVIIDAQENRDSEKIESELKKRLLAGSIENQTILISHAHALILKLTQERDFFATELKAKTLEFESLKRKFEAK